LAFEKQGGESIFSCEWDKWCQETYIENYGDHPAGDITKLSMQDIPSHDVLTAGFPCQPFSLAGVSKKKSLGREHGFLDKAQGTLFFNTAKIIKEKRPKMFLLENVKNLFNHDKGNTFKVIEGTLRDELKYHLFYDVIDARNYVPQHRERLFIVGFDKKLFRERPDFKFPKQPKTEPKLDSILEKEVDPKYILSSKLWQYLQDYAEKHRKKGNGFGFGLFDGNGVARTLSARYYKDGSEILIKVPRSSRPRRLTPRECAALQGFPKGFKIPVSDTQAYKQFGNSVAVPVVKAVAKQMLKVYKSHLKASKS
jgi:DNA (cytosine-5)-methyltransferase 1